MNRDDKASVIGLTGGIGSGKTAVANLFEQWGATVVDADTLAREVISPGSKTLDTIKQTFATEDIIVEETGELNRPAMAKLVFENEENRSRLESILHPAIRTAWLKRLEELKATNTKLIVYVVPLLFETSIDRPELESIVLVTAPLEKKIQRIIARDSLTRSQALQRIDAQLPDTQKIERSNFVIRNDNSLQKLAAQARVVFEELT
jgi:dephospho-CoA kinase